ncbi:MAG: hypothetical protein WAW80_01715 [Candidatus Saccharimonadales bacterium]
MKPEQQPDYNQPVAYDKDGNPLYAHPPVKVAEKVVAPEQFVHMTRAIDPAKPLVSDETRERHADAVRKYPTLNLSEGEYIISAIRRHPIGLLIPILFGGLLAAILLFVLVSYPMLVPGNNPSYASVILPLILALILVGLGVYIVVWVYLNNKFFLTNESVIQEIQTSLFAHHEQTVSLANIEDASYVQTGLLQILFNFGSIRLSTEGDETTYKFNYVSDPKKQIALLNNAVEAFKNGRPIEGD